MLDAGGLEKDFREMVEQELNDSRKQLEVIADELKILLLPKDPNDDRNGHADGSTQKSSHVVHNSASFSVQAQRSTCHS